VPTDFSWLPQMGEVGLGVIGVIAIAVIFIKNGLPKYLEYKKEIAVAKIAVEKETTTCGKQLQEKRETELIEIKNLLLEVDKKFNELDTGLNELKNIIEANDYLTGKTSEGTLVGLLFNDAIWAFLRMKSFRRLLAMKKNGRVWEKGFALISGSKEYQVAWLDVQETKLDIEIEDEAYYHDRLIEIENRITYDFSKRTS
jgi:hypothetical protein